MQAKILAATNSQAECELHAPHPLRLVAAEGRRIQCISGMAWITAYGQPLDVFLRSGQTFTVPNDGLVLAEAVEACRLRVDLPRSFDYSHNRSWMPQVIARLLKGLRFRPKRTA